jgi:hypothetical protein
VPDNFSNVSKYINHGHYITFLNINIIHFSMASVNMCKHLDQFGYLPQHCCTHAQNCSLNLVLLDFPLDLIIRSIAVCPLPFLIPWKVWSSKASTLERWFLTVTCTCDTTHNSTCFLFADDEDNYNVEKLYVSAIGTPLCYKTRYTESYDS